MQGAMETHTVTHRAGSHSTGPEQVEPREMHPAGSGEGCVSTQAGVTRRRRRVETEAEVALQELERKERQVARRRRRRLKRQRAKHPEGSARKKAEAMEIVGLRRRQGWRRRQGVRQRLHSARKTTRTGSRLGQERTYVLRGSHPQKGRCAQLALLRQPFLSFFRVGSFFSNPGHTRHIWRHLPK